jgi:hypothetical protein
LHSLTGFNLASSQALILERTFLASYATVKLSAIKVFVPDKFTGRIDIERCVILWGM